MPYRGRASQSTLPVTRSIMSSVIKYVFCDQAGKKTDVMTCVSHGRRSENIGSGLIGKMARQCRLSKKDFLDLVDCPLDEKGYRKNLPREATWPPSALAPLSNRSRPPPSFGGGRLRVQEGRASS